ncbi:ABC transporter substrate-binding protein [Agaricicola taiwanensis]|uniref:ABC transporter substrate-binding protein n=1 Tax=Agaricicola taiwanensis TaxID=591372 RepID=A0A8J2VNN1_9RHOB|nr:extracellular solute-binding protein [Agaricicola taiwanensis]GGE31079.1 ABC transporter substrate-binding protein [Agaricicola taiwanensis]
MEIVPQVKKAIQHTVVTCAAALMLCAGASAEEDWAAIEKAAGSEGPVLAYTTLSPENWEVILDAFNEKYPNVKVQPGRTGSHAETFEKYRAESASGTKTADVVLAVGPDQWDEFEKNGQIVPFEAQNIADLPEFTRTKTGRYTLSTDNQVIVYNKLVVPEDLWPKGTADLVAKLKAQPDIFKDKIASYNPQVSPFSYSVYWTLKEHFGEDKFWKNEAVLAPELRFEQTTGAAINKLLTGEYVVGYMLPEALLPLPDDATREVLGIVYPEDGTPVLLREMAVMKGGSSPNGGKLLVNFLTSPEGQVAVGKAGLTPYLPSVVDEVPRHYSNVVAGAENADRVAVYKWTPKVEEEMESFRAKFAELAGAK